jgi:5-oxoprolinase (ATP-hydrolysing)
MSREEVAMGFIAVANEAMCRPIRALTQGKGYDTARHALACFGGAGGQHACAIARSLGMATVIIHKYAGILSAFGMALADVVHEEQEPTALRYGSVEARAEIEQRIAELREKCVTNLTAQGFAKDQIHTEAFLHMRYEGTDCALMCNSGDNADFLDTFLHRYRTEFGFTLSGRTILVDDVRVRGTGRSGIQLTDAPERAAGSPTPDRTTRVYFEGGWQDTPVYLMEQLRPSHSLSGPAIIMDSLSTVLVEPACLAHITPAGDIRIAVGSSGAQRIGPELDTIQLSIFSHRFMSIAEQMGRILQRTSISTNIKERLDFSCALFGPDGGLVSNAPHIPVHLGAMQVRVYM